jgi:hypothetical protein
LKRATLSVQKQPMLAENPILFTIVTATQKERWVAGKMILLVDHTKTLFLWKA